MMPGQVFEERKKGWQGPEQAREENPNRGLERNSQRVRLEQAGEGHMGTHGGQLRGSESREQGNEGLR